MYTPIKEKKTILQSIKKEVNIFFKKIYWKNITNLIYFYRSFKFKKEKRVNLISLVCISKNRSKRLNKAIKHLYKNTKNIDFIELRIFIDEDDKEIFMYKKIIKDFSKKMKIYLEIGNIEKNTAKMNYLCKKSKGNLIWGFNDDMYLNKDWDEEINKESNKFHKDESYCIWANEDGLKYSYLHCNAPIISKKWYETLGYYLCEEFYHYYADNWLCDISRGTYKFIITKKKIWKHDNVDSNLNLFDETYSNLKKKSRMYDEKQTYIDLQKTKKEIISKIIN
ncbi:hypothetical protein [Candidatus Pelagibacter sp.]|uniref:hypothetical protein n=1 Tax=Candidatus Pelagibacter sp. TaxID=2024849 RepID=UPI003F85A040